MVLKELLEKVTSNTEAVANAINNTSIFGATLIFPIVKKKALEFKKYQEFDLKDKFVEYINEDIANKIQRVQMQPLLSTLLVSLSSGSSILKYCGHKFNKCTCYKIRSGLKACFKCTKCDKDIEYKLKYTPIPQCCYFKKLITNM